MCTVIDFQYYNQWNDSRSALIECTLLMYHHGTIGNVWLSELCFILPMGYGYWANHSDANVHKSGADPGGGVQGSKDPPWSPERGSWTPLPK